MTTTVRRPEMVGATGIVAAAAQPISEVLAQLGTSRGGGLSDEEVARRQSTSGPNAVASHFAVLIGMIIGYLVLIEIGKRGLLRRLTDRAGTPAVQPAASPAPTRRLLQQITLTGHERSV